MLSHITDFLEVNVMKTQWSRQLVLTFALCATGVPLGGCPLGKVGDALDTATNFAGLLDKAMDDIRKDNTKWQSIVETVAQQIPKDVQSTVQVELNDLVAHSIAKTGEEFRCDVDFMANRAIAGLQRVKDMLLNKDPSKVFDPTPPSFCQVTPQKLDMNLEDSRRNSIDLSGYGFDYKDSSGHPMKVQLFSDSNNQSIDLGEDRIGRNTSYHLVLNVGGDDMEKLIRQNKISKFRVAFDGKTEGFPEALVIPRVPRTQTVTVPLGEMEHTPPHTRGDGDFDTDDDEPMSVVVTAETQKTDTQIQTRVYMKAKEERSDWTTAESWSDWKNAYNAPAGYIIKAVSPLGSSTSQININSRIERDIAGPQGEVAHNFHIWGDHRGDEAGSYTRVKANFNDVVVTLEEVLPN